MEVELKKIVVIQSLLSFFFSMQNCFLKTRCWVTVTLHDEVLTLAVNVLELVGLGGGDICFQRSVYCAGSGI